LFVPTVTGAVTLPTAPLTLVAVPTSDPTRASPDAAPGALPEVYRLLPIDPATVKSPAVASCHTAVAICETVGAEPPVGALARAPEVNTDELVVVNAPPSWACNILPGDEFVVKSEAVVSVHTAVAIWAAVGPVAVMDSGVVVAFRSYEPEPVWTYVTPEPPDTVVVPPPVE
jgi:hypothetical protein